MWEDVVMSINFVQKFDMLTDAINKSTELSIELDNKITSETDELIRELSENFTLSLDQKLNIQLKNLSEKISSNFSTDKGKLLAQKVNQLRDNVIPIEDSERINWLIKKLKNVILPKKSWIILMD